MVSDIICVDDRYRTRYYCLVLNLRSNINQEKSQPFQGACIWSSGICFLGFWISIPSASLRRLCLMCRTYTAAETLFDILCLTKLSLINMSRVKTGKIPRLLT